jgi:hypothetical protein
MTPGTKSPGGAPEIVSSWIMRGLQRTTPSLDEYGGFEPDAFDPVTPASIPIAEAVHAAEHGRRMIARMRRAFRAALRKAEARQAAALRKAEARQAVALRKAEARQATALRKAEARHRADMRRRGVEASTSAQPLRHIEVGWHRFNRFPSSIGRMINPGAKAYSSHAGLTVAVAGPNHEGRSGEVHIVKTVGEGKETRVVLRQLVETIPGLPISFYRWGRVQ